MTVNLDLFLNQKEIRSSVIALFSHKYQLLMLKIEIILYFTVKKIN